ncbi:MAG: hypothetical protein ACE5IY_18065 [bacterium]
MIHVITKIANGEIKKVFCKGCNSTHAYKSGTTKASEKKKSAAGASTTRRRTKKPDWAALLSEVEDDQIVDYDISRDFSHVPAIRHKKFGIGVITNVLDNTKIEVVFQQSTKILAHNWR